MHRRRLHLFFPRIGILAFLFIKSREKAGERTKPTEWYGHGIVHDSLMNRPFHETQTLSWASTQQDQAHPNLLINTFSQTTL